ncbi:MAG: hypothetical protein GXX99_01065 [Clostridiales bacterium]|mgnify:CR=1 FL=1|nr:hypothetical protein [Clostridiales bacterium]
MRSSSRRAAALPQALALALERGRLPHAVLLTGPPKAALLAGRQVAKALLCAQPDGALPCGHCRACTSFEAGANPDFMPVRGERSVKVDQVRALREAVRLKPLGPRSAALIEGADTMTPGAQNALLTLLEEPPPHLTLLLQAERPALLLPTLRSRLTRYALEGAEEPPGQAQTAADLLARLQAGDLYGLLALQPHLSANRASFQSDCDALCALCRDLLAEGAGRTARLATALPKIALRYRAAAEGNAHLPLLCTAMLIDCWEARH